MERKAFTITQAEMDEVVALNNPAAGVSMNMNLQTGITIIETKSVKQLVDEWWTAVAEKYEVHKPGVKHRGGLNFDGFPLTGELPPEEQR